MFKIVLGYLSLVFAAEHADLEIFDRRRRALYGSFHTRCLEIFEVLVDDIVRPNLLCDLLPGLVESDELLLARNIDAVLG